MRGHRASLSKGESAGKTGKENGFKFDEELEKQS